MKIIVAALVAFLLGTALVSTEAEARCWWNGYNHCRWYHHGWYHHGWRGAPLLTVTDAETSDRGENIDDAKADRLREESEPSRGKNQSGTDGPTLSLVSPPDHVPPGVARRRAVAFPQPAGQCYRAGVGHWQVSDQR
jgi:hypothetical protein